MHAKIDTCLARTAISYLVMCTSLIDNAGEFQTFKPFDRFAPFQSVQGKLASSKSFVDGLWSAVIPPGVMARPLRIQYPGSVYLVINCEAPGKRFFSKGATTKLFSIRLLDFMIVG